MGRQIIELMQVLVDRIEKNGYQQRAREDNAFDLNKRLTEAEGQAKHWRQARQEAHEAGELMKAELEELRKDFVSLQWIVETIKTMAGGVSVRDADGCSLAVGQIQKYFNAAEYPLCNPQQDAAAWQQQVDSANAEVGYLRARLDEERSVSAGLRQQLDAAQAAVTLQRAGIERQSVCIGKVRAAQNNYQWPASWNEITAALAELDGEPAPVAEPLDAEGGA